MLRCGTERACGGCEVAAAEVCSTTRVAMGMAAESIAFTEVVLEMTFGEDSPEAAHETENTLHDLYICPDVTDVEVEQVRQAAERIKADCN